MDMAILSDTSLLKIKYVRDMSLLWWRGPLPCRAQLSSVFWLLCRPFYFFWWQLHVSGFSVPVLNQMVVSECCFVLELCPFSIEYAADLVCFSSAVRAISVLVFSLD